MVTAQHVTSSGGGGGISRVCDASLSVEQQQAGKDEKVFIVIHLAGTAVRLARHDSTSRR